MSEPLDPGLFEDVILDGVEPLTVGALLDALDAVGRYWLEGWPVARKLAHIRRRLWTGRNDAGWPWVWSIGWKTRVWSDRDGERGSRLTPEQARALVKQIATPHWQTLDEIRARLKAEGWFPLHATERRQVEALEAILGTEVDSPEPSLDDSENELALVACNWDDLDAPEPQPVYKVREAMTSEDQARERAHLRAWARDFDDVARARQRAFRRGRDGDAGRNRPGMSLSRFYNHARGGPAGGRTCADRDAVETVCLPLTPPILRHWLAAPGPLHAPA